MGAAAIAADVCLQTVIGTCQWQKVGFDQAGPEGFTTTGCSAVPHTLQRNTGGTTYKPPQMV
jgi:hypothetical protein